ncbi:MAG: PaaI family thioesterase [Anaerolineae bacterium]|nr:PaaI family thioesterase [Anaerolineae bacterium]
MEQKHPFAELIGLQYLKTEDQLFTCKLEINPSHLNPNGVVHGGVLYTLADTCMGGALFYSLEEGKTCATVEIKISYFKPVREGSVICRAKIIHRGNSLASLEAEVTLDELLVSKAYGTFAIFNI